MRLNRESLMEATKRAELFVEGCPSAGALYARNFLHIQAHRGGLPLPAGPTWLSLDGGVVVVGANDRAFYAERVHPTEDPQDGEVAHLLRAELATFLGDDKGEGVVDTTLPPARQGWHAQEKLDLRTHHRLTRPQDWSVEVQRDLLYSALRHMKDNRGGKGEKHLVDLVVCPSWSWLRITSQANEPKDLSETIRADMRAIVRGQPIPIDPIDAHTGMTLEDARAAPQRIVMTVDKHWLARLVRAVGKANYCYSVNLGGWFCDWGHMSEPNPPANASWVLHSGTRKWVRVAQVGGPIVVTATGPLRSAYGVVMPTLPNGDGEGRYDYLRGDRAESLL